MKQREKGPSDKIAKDEGKLNGQRDVMVQRISKLDDTLNGFLESRQKFVEAITFEILMGFEA